MIARILTLNNQIKVFKQLQIVVAFALLYWIGGKLEKYYKLKELDGNIVTDKDVTPMSLYDSFYFSLITHSTVGYGQIVPKSRITQTINICHLLFIIGIFIYQ